MEQSLNPAEAALEFTRVMLAGAARLQTDIGYNPNRFRQMVAEHGGVEAAHRLLQGPGASEGFGTLWEAGRLHLSLEAHVVLPRFGELFTDEEKAVARSRLEAYEFDVDAFLTRVGDGLP